MQSTIIADRLLLPGVLRELLPTRLLCEIEATVSPDAHVEEIRLRRRHVTTLTVNAKNLRLQTTLDDWELDELLVKMCEGSLYAHSETICQGYVTLRGGIRVGVCGKACVIEGRVSGVLEPSALVIRIPHATPPIGREIALLLREMQASEGILLYAPPGVGKTTVLRGTAALLAEGEEALRVAVVDTRGELGYALDHPSLLVDILSGYPRGVGASIAVRALAAQVIVCDEIGDLGEAKALLEAHICGVPLLATAHAASVRELLTRPGIRLLHEAGCFGAYVRLSRGQAPFSFDYTVITREAADALL